MVFMPSLTDTTSGTGETTTPGTPGFTLAGALVAVLYFAFSRRRDR
jgi:MYXO-CTERM domain-containing protein